MRNVLFTLETGFIGADWEEEFEFEDDATDEEINAELADWAQDKLSYMDYRWEEI